MIKSVRYIPILLLLFSSVIFNGNTSYATGWLDDIKSSISFNTTYTDEWVSKDDWDDWDKNAYEVHIPEKGKIDLHLECEKWVSYASVRTWGEFFIYKTDNVDKEFYSDPFYVTYSEARDVYYIDLSIILPKGTYYFLLEGPTKAGNRYSFIVSYSPNFSNQYFKTIKCGKRYVKASWYKDSVADTYILQISTQKKFSDETTKSFYINSNKSSKKISGLKRNTKYWCRFRSTRTLRVGNEDILYKSSWSSKYSFRTK